MDHPPALEEDLWRRENRNTQVEINPGGQSARNQNGRCLGNGGEGGYHQIVKYFRVKGNWEMRKGCYWMWSRIIADIWELVVSGVLCGVNCLRARKEWVLRKCKGGWEGWVQKEGGETVGRELPYAYTLRCGELHVSGQKGCSCRKGQNKDVDRK